MSGIRLRWSYVAPSVGSGIRLRWSYGGQVSRTMLLAALALTLPACGWTPADEQVLRKFFEESRLYDRTLLAAHGTVVFDPGTNGVVQQFEVLERGADQQIAPGSVRRQLTVRADVRSSEGRVEPKTLAVTLERQNDRWMVTAFR